MELEEARKRSPKQETRDESSTRGGDNTVTTMSKDLVASQAELQKVLKENSSLRSKLEKETTKAREKVASLTEECRKAQAKAHKLERDGRYDLAVQSEVARLRFASAPSPDRRGGSSQRDDWIHFYNPRL